MTERVGEPSPPVVSGTISIGEVLQLLKREFPDVTISKIRFLESEGLVTPERTASGYRRFAQRDIDQLRAVLTLQRDQYLPLKVIRDHIEAGMADPEAAAKLPVAGTGLRPDDFRAGAGRVRMTREELAEACDLTEAFIAQLEAHRHRLGESAPATTTRTRSPSPTWCPGCRRSAWRRGTCAPSGS